MESCKKCSICQVKNCTVKYVVIGAGAGGSMALRLLSNDKKTSVLGIERGSYLADDPVVVDNVNLGAPLRRTKNDDLYLINESNQPNGLLGVYGLEFGKGGPGGSTVHYFCNATRGTQWDEWAAQLNDPIWSYDNMLPILKSIEAYNGLTENPSERGDNGPLSIMQNGDPMNDQLTNAMADAYDIPVVADHNLNIVNAVTASQRLVKETDDGRRVRVWGADLLPINILARNGSSVDGRKLQILFNTTADKLLFEDPCDTNRVTGVQFISSDKKIHKVNVKKGVILAGGPIGTVGVLQRSGIGPLSVLQAAGVEPKIVNENVGRHFKTHIGITTPYATQGFPIPEFSGPIQNKSIMAFDDGHTVGYPQDNLRRFEHLFTGFGGLLPEVSGVLGIPLNSPNVNNWYLRPRSEGTVEIVSPDPQILPQINPRIYSDGGIEDPNSDASAIVRVIKQAKALADSLGVQLLYPTPQQFLGGDAALFQAARSAWNTSSHFHQYNRMGTSSANSVTDSKLKVWNVPNLWVGDMGVSPGFVTGHTALPVFAVAARLATILGFQVTF